MHTRLNPIGTAVLSLLIGGNAGAAEGLLNPYTAFQGFPVVSDQTLSHLRGGFSVPFGGATLNIAFAIQRVTYINGQLQAVTQLTVPSLNTVATPAMPAMPATPAMPTVSVPTPPARPAIPGAAIPVAGQPAPTSSITAASGGTPVASPAAAQSVPGPSTSGVAPAIAAARTSASAAAQVAAAPGSSSTAGSAGTVAVPPAVVTVNGPVTTVQNGVGNTVNLSNLSSLTRQSLLVIQNSLDNQHIQTATVVDATVSNMALYKAMNLSSTITQAITNSLH